MSAGRIDTARVEAQLIGPLAGPVVWFDEIGSTSDEVANRARLGAAEGLVVGADHQTAGRGRRGRVWHDTPGASLAVSMLVRPSVRPADSALLPLVAAVAVADALTSVGCSVVTIAWPNDVFVAGRKVAGILCELTSDATAVHWGVIGIGVNVTSVPDVPDARWEPGALIDAVAGIARDVVLVAILNALSRRYAEWARAGAAPVTTAFASFDALAGREIAVQVDGAEVLGLARGIDGDGRLVLACADRVRHLAAAEVTRIVTTGP